MLTIGRPAPLFRLPNQDGKPVSLADLAGGWVVLYFYPRDDTPGCTVEACEFTAAAPSFAGLDATVLGCSADSATAHQKFIAKHRLGITLLSDADRSVMKVYGAFGKKKLYGKEVEGVIRSTVLIAPDGTVAHHWRTVKAAGHAEHVRSRLAEVRGASAETATASSRSRTTKQAPKRAPTAAASVAKRPAKKAAKKAAKK